MDDDMKRQQFLKALEPAVAEANRHAIHAKLPKVNQEIFLRFAVSVARVRAEYLAQAMTLADREHGGVPNDAEVAQLAGLRARYEEAVKAYDALAHAVERGYVELDGGA